LTKSQDYALAKCQIEVQSSFYGNPIPKKEGRRSALVCEVGPNVDVDERGAWLTRFNAGFYKAGVHRPVWERESAPVRLLKNCRHGSRTDRSFSREGWIRQALLMLAKYLKNQCFRQGFEIRYFG
jgi:hypothetical protein